MFLFSVLQEGYDSSDGVIHPVYTSPASNHVFFFWFYFPNTPLQGLVTPTTKTPRRQRQHQRTHLTKMTLTSPPQTWKDLYDGAFLTTRIFIHSWRFLMMTITPRFILSHLVFIYFLLFFFFGSAIMISPLRERQKKKKRTRSCMTEEELGNHYFGMVGGSNEMKRTCSKQHQQQTAHALDDGRWRIHLLQHPQTGEERDDASRCRDMHGTCKALGSRVGGGEEAGLLPIQDTRSSFCMHILFWQQTHARTHTHTWMRDGNDGPGSRGGGVLNWEDIRVEQSF